VRFGPAGMMVWPLLTFPSGKVIVLTQSPAQQNSSKLVDPFNEFSVVSGNSLEVVSRFKTPHWPSRDNLASPSFRYGFGIKGKYFAITGGLERQVWLFDLNSGQDVRRIKTVRRAYELRMTSDEQTLAVSVANKTGDTRAQVELYDTNTGLLKRTLDYSGMMIYWMRFSPDGKFLVGSNISGEAYLWNVKTGKLVTRLTNGNDIREMSFSPNSERMVSTGLNESFYTVWDARTGAELLTIPTESSEAVRGLTDATPKFSADGRDIYAAGKDGAIRIWHSEPRTGHAKAERKKAP